MAEINVAQRLKKQGTSKERNCKPTKKESNTPFLKWLTKGAEGASAVEYGLLLALIAVVILGSVQLLGKNVSSTLDKAANGMANQQGGGGGGGGGGGCSRR